MKMLLKISLFSVCCLSLASFNFHDSSLSFEKALSEKKIEIQIISTGTYHGNSINLKVTNLTNSNLSLELTPGTVFIPGDSEEQTLVVPGAVLMALEKNQTRTFHINAYCTEASDRCPSVDSKFAIAQTQNPSLKKLVHYLDSLKTPNENTIQQSIWCVTDSESVSSVYDQDPKVSKALRGYLCSLTGQKDTWYTTERDLSVDRNNNIVSIPKEIKGDISFETTESVELQGCVVDSTGKVLVTNPNKTTCPPGKIKFEFNLKVAGWKAGNYAVVYTNNGKEVIHQPFSF